MVDTRSPVAETPLSQQGHSLQTGELTVDAGLYTNIALLDRPQNAARILDNLQQLIPGIWTSSNLGWTPQRASVFNSGAPFLEFSYFIDNTGTRTLLFQVGSALYSYNISTNTETAITTGLNATAIPCIRRSYSQLTAQSVAMYCSSASQPQKITSTSAAALANFNQKFPNIAPVGLTIANGGTPGSTQYGYTAQTVYANGSTSVIPASASTFTGNANLSTGLNGFAIFNGSNQSLSKASNSSLQIGGTSFTWSGWVTPTQVGVKQALFSKISNTTTTGDYQAFISASNFLDFGIFNGATANTGENSSTFGGFVSGTQYFICVWWDSTGPSLNLQVNNGTIYTQATTITPTASAADLDLGADQTGGADFFKGNMTNVSFWKRLLTPTERTTLFNGGVPPYYANLPGAMQSESTSTFVSYWNLSEVSGTRADSRTSANNLTSNNSVGSGGNIPASNVVQWIPVPNAVGYNIYRTQSSGTPNTTGLIASNQAGTLGTNSLGNTVLTFSDSGSAASGTSSMAPGSPSIVVSAGGTTIYGYTVVAVYANGAQAASGQTIITTGNISLNNVGANNALTWTAATGATSYKIYRSLAGISATALPSQTATGLIGVVGPSVLTFTDIGQSADGTTPQTISPNIVNVQGTWNNTGPYFGNFNVNTNSGKTYQKPQFCEPLGTRMIYAGFPDAATAFDIIISDANNIEQFTVSSPGLATDSVAFSYPPQLGALVGIKTMRLSNQTNQTVIIGGCTNGIFMITGSDATNYAMFTLTEEIGILSNRTWIQISNDMYFLSTAGIRNLSSLANNAILTPDEVSKNIHDQFVNIDTANAYKAFAVHYPATQEVQFWYPQIGDTGLCSHAFIMNYNSVNSTQPGTMNGVKWSTRSGTTVNCGINFGGTFYGGGNDGLLQQHYTGNNYNTTPMIFQLATSMIVMPYPIQKFSMRDFIVITEGNAQHFPLTPYVNRKMTDGSWQRFPAYPQNAVVHSANPPLTILGSWALGYGAFPGKVNKLLSMQFTGEGNFWDVEISSGSGADMLDFQAICYTMSGGGFER